MKVRFEMKQVLFFDVEVSEDTDKIWDIGAVKNGDAEFHEMSLGKFREFATDCAFACGHNIFAHDLNYVGNTLELANPNFEYIDTLLLSPLFFPDHYSFKLMKNDKLISETKNNPCNDSKKAKELFDKEIAAYNALPPHIKNIFCSLLYNVKEFQGFFRYIGATPDENIQEYIKSAFAGKLCINSNINEFVQKNPIELAYCISMIHAEKNSDFAPWVFVNYPKTCEIMTELRFTHCADGCRYCNEHLNIHKRLKKIFGFDEFRVYEDEPLQEKAVQAATNGESLLVIFPTGGGKSVTFQLPALISGEAVHGLTVVISPLVSLMKDQVDNLQGKEIANAVTINGTQNLVERQKSIESVQNGFASILYISPESLRSATIEKILLERNVVRFVIDEAHCLSAWGQDFRVDYMYIGDFINSLMKKKKIVTPIPVSCFTATAKQKVISDIKQYFRDKLGVELNQFATASTRDNLRYEVHQVDTNEEKYNILRNVIQAKNCPTIVYVSRVKQTVSLAERLTRDGFFALPYNGKMKSEEKRKNQEAFMRGKDNGEDGTDIIVATTAFGMGIDKDNVGLVVHYDISDSPENYIQEAGRAGRNPNMSAECHILFNDNDLNKHFSLLNESKLSFGEIKQIWKAIKTLTKNNGYITRTPYEIAKAAGWEEDRPDTETKVKTALSALEHAGYIERGRNVPRIYADGILAYNMQEASDKIEAANILNDEDKQNAKRIIKFLISARSRAKAGTSESESRVDYIANILGLEISYVVDIVNKMKEANVLADSHDMIALLSSDDAINKLHAKLKTFSDIEDFLIENLPNKGPIDYKELNEAAQLSGIKSSCVKDIKTVIYYWLVSGFLKKSSDNEYMQFIYERVINEDKIKESFQKRQIISDFIISYLWNLHTGKYEESEDFGKSQTPENSKTTIIDFSIKGIMKAFNSRDKLIGDDYVAELSDIKNVLFYLSKIQVISLDGGFLVLYNAIQIKNLKRDNRLQYKKNDYSYLETFYQKRIQQIHFIGEFAHLLLKNYRDAMFFIKDYFQMDYDVFIRKYFTNRENEINRGITPEKYNKLFSSLSYSQREVIDENEAKYIVVAAGPGSGKTKVLVHKLASLLLLEDIKSEQLLMLTFSRSAAIEFKSRLIELIGDAAFFVEIKTFHSYCFDLLGRIGNLSDASDVVKKAADMISSGNVDPSKITKLCLVIDEAQDMDSDEFALIESLMQINEDMRVIAVGDDDQNIFAFRGSDSKHMRELIDKHGAKQYELLDNYRSDKTIVALANRFAASIKDRMKKHPIEAISKESGIVQLTKFVSKNKNLEEPLLHQIQSQYHGEKCCILTATNEQAIKITGLLNKHNIRAKLIQSTDGFNLYDLLEIRTFCNLISSEEESAIISQDKWDKAIQIFTEKYSTSTCYPECKNIFDKFDETDRIKYYSDFIEYIHESKYEDFVTAKDNSVMVSTIHKSKGREFDTVYLVLSDYNIEKDDDRHVLYVAMTRAKHELYILCNNGILDDYTVAPMKITEDLSVYSEPREIMLQFSHKQIFLDTFSENQNRIKKIHSGSELKIDNGNIFAYDGKYANKIGRLSKSSIELINQLNQRDYNIYKSCTRFIVYWKQKNNVDSTENLIVLPDIYLRKEKNILNH